MRRRILRRPDALWVPSTGETRVGLRLIAYLALLALPVGAAVWAAGNYAAAGERRNADARLNGVLGSALGEYARVADEAEVTSRALASTGRVQRALATKDRAELAELQRSEPHVVFATDVAAMAAVTRRPSSLVRTTEVVSDAGRVGWVVVAVPLDRALLTRLGGKVGLARGDRLALVAGDLVALSHKGGDPMVGSLAELRSVAGGLDRPAEVSLAGGRYRAVSARLLPGRPGARLVALTPAATVAAAANDVRRRVLFAGLITLGSVLLIAYALAPAIARGRVGQQRRALASRVLSHVGDGIFLVDGKGVIRFWNPAAEAITGLSTARILGRPATDAIPGWEAVAPLIPVLESHGGPHEAPPTETVPLTFAGKDLWLSISAVGFEEGTVYAFRDLTEERRLEENRADFVSTISHELRTPLASIHGAAVTLGRDDPELEPATQEQLLAVISQESTRLALLVEQILLASQLSSGHLTVETDSFDADSLARGVVESAQARSPEHAIDLHVRPPLGPVAGSEDRARQVLTNLVENAVKYSPGGGRVEVGLQVTGGHLRFSVRDHGLGIPATEHDRIFEKFYRLDPQLTRGVGGSGLGLYISRELLRQMSGRIWVSSKPGQGSTFTFELPLTDAAPVEHPVLARTLG
ncbi:MAG: sensor histidine kinase [Gaiellaceae bacterium]